MCEDYEIWQIIASLKKSSHYLSITFFQPVPRIPEKPKVDMQDKIIYLEGMGGQVLALREKGWSV
ncbi:MAG: hypothetical protein JW932_07090 [Deltaproteobacteria bacterium]|nr:hypothetical protein [Deltaproteobacteria bacterium]